MITLNEKIEKEKKRLSALLEQKKELDRKIQRAQDNIGKYEAMQKQKSYKETDELLIANNLTIEMINEAIKKGNLSELQSLIDENREKN